MFCVQTLASRQLLLTAITTSSQVVVQSFTFQSIPSSFTSSRLSLLLLLLQLAATKRKSSSSRPQGFGKVSELFSSFSDKLSIGTMKPTTSITDVDSTLMHVLKNLAALSDDEILTLRKNGVRTVHYLRYLTPADRLNEFLPNTSPIKRDILASIIRYAFNNYEFDTGTTLNQINQVNSINSIVQEKNEEIRIRNDFIDNLEESKVKLEAELSFAQAKFSAVTNLRPVIEHELRKWYKKRNKNTKVGIQKMIDELFECNETKETMAKLLRSTTEQYKNTAGEEGDLPPNIKANNNMESTYKVLYHELSRSHHNSTNSLGIDTIGFVVCEQNNVSIVTSAILKYFDVEHTVYADNYKKILYKYP